MRACEASRISYLDGLRGAAALIVFMNHLMTSFVPAVSSINPQEVHTSFFASLVLSPFAVFCSGNFAVCIFFVLSGFVLSDFCQRTRLSFLAQLTRRYFRLAVPMLLTSTFAWILLHFGLYNNLIASKEVTHSAWLPNWYNFTPNILEMLKETLFNVFISGEANYNCNLWTMQFELIGSAFVFALFVFLKNRYLRLLTLLFFIPFDYQSYYLLFAWGVLLFDFQHDLALLIKRLLPWYGVRGYLMMLGFVGAVYLGGFPITPPELVSEWYPGFNKVFSALHWHMLGAMLLILFLLQSKELQILFGGKFGEFFGKISFVLYLIHVPIICSLTSWIIYSARGLPFYQMFFISSFLTVVTVILSSTLLYQYIDQYTTTFSRWTGRQVDQWLNFGFKKLLKLKKEKATVYTIQA